jgi:hypothetical protein
MNYLRDMANIYDEMRFMIYENAVFARHAELERKYNDGVITPEEISEAEQIVKQITRLPRKVFYVKDIEIIRNPKDKDYQQISKEYREKYPFARGDDPSTRFTTDSYGNRWIWRADEGMHSYVEPLIAQIENKELGQNEANWGQKLMKPFTGKPLQQRFKL